MIAESITEIKQHKSVLQKTVHCNTELYRNHISKLISDTPTGELRNRLTEINILAECI